jgi:hypothetical protein
MPLEATPIPFFQFFIISTNNLVEAQTGKMEVTLMPFTLQLQNYVW